MHRRRSVGTPDYRVAKSPPNCRNKRSANAALTAATSEAVNGSEETTSAHTEPAMSSRPKTDQVPPAVSTTTALRIRGMNEGRSIFVSRQARTNRAGSGRTQAPTALRFTRATVSTKAVAIVTTHTDSERRGHHGTQHPRLGLHAGDHPAEYSQDKSNDAASARKPTPPTATLTVQRESSIVPPNPQGKFRQPRLGTSMSTACTGVRPPEQQWFEGFSEPNATDGLRRAHQATELP